MTKPAIKFSYGAKHTFDSLDRNLQRKILIRSQNLPLLVQLKQVQIIDTVYPPYRYRHTSKYFTLEFGLDSHQIPILLNIILR